MDIEGLQLAARFAWSPNALGFCGSESAPKKLRECIVAGNCQGVEEEISQFNSLNPYLQTIGKVTGKNPYSLEVVECYWLGNNLLDIFEPEHFEILLEEFASQETLEEQLEEMRKHAPKRFIPFHLSQVLLAAKIGGHSTKSNNLSLINNCMIRWGLVESIDGTKAKVMLQSLGGENKPHSLVLEAVTADFEPIFVPNLENGAMVAVHWNWVCKVLTTTEATNLLYWTREVLVSYKKRMG